VPYTLSIRERIEIRFCQLIDGVSSIGNVFRFDMRGVQTAAGDAIVQVGDETVRHDESGLGYTENTLELGVGVLLAQVEAIDQNTMYAHNAFVAAIESAVLADHMFVEPAPSGVQLLHKPARLTERSAAPILDDQNVYWCAVVFEVEYMHDYGNPYAYGTIISALTVTDLPTWSRKKLSA
jgi:hypothetical protein